MIMAQAASTQQTVSSPPSQREQQQQSKLPPQQQQQQQQGSRLLQAGAGLLSTLLWCFASSTLIVINNNLYKGGFPFPLMVTGLGQLFSAGSGLILSRLGLLPLSRGPPSSPRELLVLLPLVSLTAGTMFLGNAPYMHLSLSFIQILKAATPALTLLVGVAAGLERITAVLLLAVTLIALGTGGAVLAESGAPTYNMTGLLLFLGSSLTEAGRVVVSQLLLGPYRYSSGDVLVYVGIPTAATLIGSSILFERQAGLIQAFQTLLPTKPWTFIQAGFMSALVNLSSYLAISTTSSLTFKVSGCLKNLGVVWYGVVSHGDVVTIRHMLGYAVSLAGFVIYTYSRQAKPQAAAAAGGGSKAKAS